MQLLSVFPECTIAVTTNDDGGIESSAQIDALIEQHGVPHMKKIILPTHEHRTHIILTDALDKENGPFVADGLSTKQTMTALAHRVADCVPIVILDRHHRALCTLHAGWKGTVQGIVPIGVLTLMNATRAKPEDLWVWLGPCIQKASYVQQDPPLQLQLSAWKPFIEQMDDGYHVDVPGFIEFQLQELGIPETHIISDGRDTYTNEQLYSHKRSVVENNPELDKRFAVVTWLT